MTKWLQWLVFVVILLVHSWFVTYGSMDFTEPELRGRAFDSLAQSLLRLEADVEPSAINWEGLDLRGRKFMYWGPFPAFLRVPLNFLWPEHYGEWSRLSVLLASALSLLAVLLLYRYSLKESVVISEPGTSLMLPLLLITWGLGTPLLYLVSCARIYHESIAWALAASSWAVLAFCAGRWGAWHRDTVLLVMAMAAGVGLLSRITFGVPLYFFLLVSCQSLFHLNSRSRGIDWWRILCLTAPAWLMLGFQAWYNYVRFENIFSFIDYSGFYLNPEKELSGTFDFGRVPYSFWVYFGFDLRSFIREIPYIQMPTVYYSPSYWPLYWQGWREQVLSLSLGSPWLVLTAIFGCLHVIRAKIWSDIAAVLALAAQVVLILGYFFLTERYAVECLPFLLLCQALYFRSITHWSYRRILVLSLLCYYSILANILAVVSWLMVYAAPGIDVPSFWQELLQIGLGYRPEISGGIERRVYLDTLEPVRVSAAVEPVQLAFASNEEISFGGSQYRHGLLMHAPSEVSFEVPQGAYAFESLVGLSDAGIRCHTASIHVSLRGETGILPETRMLFAASGVAMADGEIVSGPPRLRRMKHLLSGVRQLTLSVDDAGDGRNCDRAVWLSPAFLLRNEEGK